MPVLQGSVTRDEKKKLDEAEERVKLLKDLEKFEDPGTQAFIRHAILARVHAGQKHICILKRASLLEPHDRNIQGCRQNVDRITYKSFSS